MSEQIKDKKRMSVAERREARKKKIEQLEGGGFSFPTEEETNKRKEDAEKAAADNRTILDPVNLPKPRLNPDIKRMRPIDDRFGNISTAVEEPSVEVESIEQTLAKTNPIERAAQSYMDTHKQELVDKYGRVIPLEEKQKKRLYTYKGVTKEITDKQIDKIRNRALAWGESEFRKNPKRLERYKAQLEQYLETLKSGEADLNVIGAEAERNIFDRITNPEDYAGYIFSQAINEGFGFKSDGSKSDAMVEAEEKATAEKEKKNYELYTERMLKDIYGGNKTNYETDLKYLDPEGPDKYTFSLEERAENVQKVINTFEGYEDFQASGGTQEERVQSILKAVRELGITTADVQNYLNPQKPKDKGGNGSDGGAEASSFSAISKGVNPEWVQAIDKGISLTEDSPEWVSKQDGSTRYAKVKDGNGNEKWVVFQKDEKGQWGVSDTVSNKKTILKKDGNSVLYADEDGQIRYIDNYQDDNTEVPQYLNLFSNDSSQQLSLTMPQQGVWSTSTANIEGKGIDLSGVVGSNKYAIYPAGGNTNMYRIVTYDTKGNGTLVNDKVIYTDGTGELKIGTVTHNKNSSNTVKDAEGHVIKDKFKLGMETTPISSLQDPATAVESLQATAGGVYKNFNIGEPQGLTLITTHHFDQILAINTVKELFPDFGNDVILQSKYLADLRDQCPIDGDKLYWGELPASAKEVKRVNKSLDDINTSLNGDHVAKLSGWLNDRTTRGEGGDGAKLRDMAQYQLLYLRHIVAQYVGCVNHEQTDNITRLNSIIDHVNELTKAYNENQNPKIGKLPLLPTLVPKGGGVGSEQTQTEKQGGTIRHLQDGGNIGIDEETIARINAATEQANKEYEAKKAREAAKQKEREEWLADPKNKPTFRFGGDKNKGNQGTWGLRETGQAAATALDVLSVAGGPVGFAASLASTAIDAVADFTDDTLTSREKWIRFGTNLAFTGLAAIPFLKSLKLAGKLGKAVKGADTANDLRKAADTLKSNRNLAQAVADRANTICGTNVTAAQTGEILKHASTFWSSAWRGVKGAGEAIGKGAKAVGSNKAVQNTIKGVMYTPVAFNLMDAGSSILNGDGLTMSQFRGIASPLMSRAAARHMDKYCKNMGKTINKLFPSGKEPGKINVKFEHEGVTKDIEIPYTEGFKKKDYLKAAKEELMNLTGEEVKAMQKANSKWRVWDNNSVTLDKESLKNARSAANSIGSGYDPNYLKSLMTDENLSSAQRAVLRKLEKSGALSTEELKALKNMDEQIDAAAQLLVGNKGKGFTGTFTTKDVGHADLFRGVKSSVSLPQQKFEVHVPSRWTRPWVSGNDVISVKSASYKNGGSLSFEQRVYLKNLDAQNRASVNTTKTFIEDLKLLAKKAENAEKGFRQERLLILKGLK